MILIPFLFFWFHHVERVSVTLDTHGEAIIEFKKDFPSNDAFSCTFKSKHNGVKLVAWGKEGIHIQGHPGERVKVRCQ